MHKIQECLRNRIKQARCKLQKKGNNGDEGTSKKRQRKSRNDQLFRRYPLQRSNDPLDDPHSVEDHCKAMSEEMKKASPRDTLLLPLLKSTYSSRRMYICGV